MKRTLVISGILSASVLHGAAALAENVNPKGIHLGMSLDDTRGLLSCRVKRTAGAYTCEESAGRIAGIATHGAKYEFDAGAKLVKATYTIDVSNLEAAKAALSERLGAPVNHVTDVPVTNGGARYLQERMTWLSEAGPIRLEMPGPDATNPAIVLAEQSDG